jgi:hypothetical protein
VDQAEQIPREGLRAVRVPAVVDGEEHAFRESRATPWRLGSALALDGKPNGRSQW